MARLAMASARARAKGRASSRVPDVVAQAWPPGTADVVARLDALGVPIDHSSRACQTALRDAGTGARRERVVAAQRWRKQMAPA